MLASPFLKLLPLPGTLVRRVDRRGSGVGGGRHHQDLLQVSSDYDEMIEMVIRKMTVVVAVAAV